MDLIASITENIPIVKTPHCKLQPQQKDVTIIAIINFIKLFFFILI